MGRRCCGCCEIIRFNTASRWAPEEGATADDGSGDNQVELDGEVNPVSFITGKEAWLLRFSMSGEVTFTIDGDDYAIDTDAQTIAINSDGADIGQNGRHLPSSDLFAFELRVTPTHAYLIGWGNYQFADLTYAHAILTVTRSSDAPDSFTADWSNAVVEDFQIEESEVAVDDSGETPVFTKNCWTPPATTCAYKVVKKISRDHLYQDDVSYLADYWMPDFSVTGWDPWAYVFQCFTPTWATGAVLRCNSSPTSGDGDDPLVPYQTHRISNLCASGGVIYRWFESYVGGEDYRCEDWTSGNAFFSYGYSFELEWEDATTAAPYSQPNYAVSFSLEFTFDIYCGFAPNQQRDRITSGGTASADLSPTDFEDGFTLTITGSKSIETISGSGDPMCTRLSADCVTYESVSAGTIYGEIGIVTGSWVW